MTATIRLQRETFDAGAEAQKLARARTDIGAVVTFTGICRGEENGEPIAALTLEHYPGMAEAEIARHVEAARKPLVAPWRHGDPPPRPHPAGRGDRAGGHGLLAPPGCLRGGRIPDGLSQDARAVLEAGRILPDRKADRTTWVGAKSSDDTAADRWTSPAEAVAQRPNDAMIAAERARRPQRRARRR